jgi:NAD(P)-dependent dehydrogenase (short-subunit alcohol dehydrogenase family)
MMVYRSRVEKRHEQFSVDCLADFDGGLHVALFEGKAALVTGGGGGIGRAAALAFAREGASVTIGNRDVERGEETVELIRKAGGSAAFLRTDITVAADNEALVAFAAREFGGLDFAFNNAGVFPRLSPITELSEQDFDLAMSTNAKGTWLSMKYELRHMQGQGHGVIVNNASVGGILGQSFGFAAYVASKHAVVGLTKCAALENAKAGVRVNVICPGIIDTDMAKSFADNLGITPEQFGEAHPVGRNGRPEEIASAVIYLCTDGAAFMTGSTVVMDGGLSAQ